jgi:hypothetical protein
MQTNSLIPEHHKSNFKHKASLLNLSCGAGNLAKFGLQAGNMKLNTQNED